MITIETPCVAPVNCAALPLNDCLKELKQAFTEVYRSEEDASLTSRCKNEEHNTGITTENYGTAVTTRALKAVACTPVEEEMLSTLFEFKPQGKDCKKPRKFFRSNLNSQLYFITEPYGSQHHPDLMLVFIHDDGSFEVRYIDWKSADSKPQINGGFNPPEKTRTYIVSNNHYLILSYLRKVKRITFRTKSQLVSDNFDVAFVRYCHLLEIANEGVLETVDAECPGWRSKWEPWDVQRSNSATGISNPFKGKDLAICHELSAKALDLFCKTD